MDSKTYIKTQRSQNSKNNLRKKNKVGGFNEFKTWYQFTIITTLWEQHKGRHAEQKGEARSQPEFYSQPISDKCAKVIQQKKEPFFQQILLEQ